MPPLLCMPLPWRSSLVFGYTGLIAQPVAWVQLVLSILGFLNIEFVAVWVLSFVRDGEDES